MTRRDDFPPKDSLWQEREPDDLAAARGIGVALVISIAVGLITYVVCHWTRW